MGFRLILFEGRLFQITAAEYLNDLPPCYFLYMFGIISRGGKWVVAEEGVVAVLSNA